jgi:hypothetical protein
MDSPVCDQIPDPIEAFTPKMEITEEFEVLQNAKKTLGGDRLRPIEIDMDVLVDAYPREGKFLSRSTAENSSSSTNHLERTPAKGSSMDKSPSVYSSRKTPNRRFFKSDHEREYARNLMKELVQIYILQGIHGKEAFRKALNETKKRIHLRRGEEVPTPPPVLSPVHVSPYPKLSPPKEVETPYSQRGLARPVAQSPSMPVKRLDPSADNSGSPIEKPVAIHMVAGTPRTPSRVKSMVAAIQSGTPDAKRQPSEVVQKTPGTSRVKAVADALERTISSQDVVEVPSADHTRAKSLQRSAVPKKIEDSPVKGHSVTAVSGNKAAVSPKKALDMAEKEDEKRNSSPQKVAGSPVKATPPSKRKNQEIVEKVSSSRGRRKAETPSEERAVSPPADERKRVRRAAAIAAQEEMSSQSAKKTKKKSNETEANLLPITTSGRKSAAPKKTKAVSKRKKPSAELETIPEDEAVAMPPRPVRKAKIAANEGLIKI